MGQKRNHPAPVPAQASALEQAYRQRETVFAQTMADRADWDTATRAQRQMAVAADAELRRRHPGQHFPPLRSAEPEPAPGTQRAELTLTPDQSPGEMDQWIKDLATGHRTFVGKLADRQSQAVPSDDPDYADLGPAFPAWTSHLRSRSCSHPCPRSRPPRGSSGISAGHATVWQNSIEPGRGTGEALHAGARYPKPTVGHTHRG